MISVVCVSNNIKVLNDCLLKGLKGQTAKYESIIIDNAGGKYRSAAMALNAAAGRAHGKYIMFVHQDVDLSSDTWLAGAEKILDSIQDLGIAGVAGIKDRRGGVLSNILHCIPPKLVSDTLLTETVTVQTLDECLLIIPRTVFEKRHFDEKVCDDWHLYGVDYCLSIKEFGLGVFILPLTLYHMTFSTTATQNVIGRLILSMGAFPAALPSGYYSTLKKLASKHRKAHRTVYTTCGIWSTRFPIGLQRTWTVINAVVKYPLSKISISRREKKHCKGC